MGYLNNSVVTVDAILTKKGRELLARGDGSFRISQFALADDEIDYTLYNTSHPSGSAYYGEAIENMPENLRYSSKGEEREEIADNIEEHMSAVDSLRYELEEIAEGTR